MGFPVCTTSPHSPSRQRGWGAVTLTLCPHSDLAPAHMRTGRSGAGNAKSGSATHPPYCSEQILMSPQPSSVKRGRNFGVQGTPHPVWRGDSAATILHSEPRHVGLTSGVWHGNRSQNASDSGHGCQRVGQVVGRGRTLRNDQH